MASVRPKIDTLKLLPQGDAGKGVVRNGTSSAHVQYRECPRADLVRWKTAGLDNGGWARSDGVRPEREEVPENPDAQKER